MTWIVSETQLGQIIWSDFLIQNLFDIQPVFDHELNQIFRANSIWSWIDLMPYESILNQIIPNWTIRPNPEGQK